MSPVPSAGLGEQSERQPSVPNGPAPCPRLQRSRLCGGGHVAGIGSLVPTGSSGIRAALSRVSTAQFKHPGSPAAALGAVHQVSHIRN